MAIPNYQTVMLPLLQLAAQHDELKASDATSELAKHFQLSEAEKNERLPNINVRRFNHRVGWAKTYLAQAKLLESTRRGYFKITDQGREVLTEDLAKIDVAYLDQFPSFQEFRERSRVKAKSDNSNLSVADEEHDSSTLQTPEDQMEKAAVMLREGLVAELVQLLQTLDWKFFEQLIVDVLIALGYGGSRREAGMALQTSGDGGIDGTIKEDRLGLDIIYLQGKRWQESKSVGRPEIQKFSGALDGQRAKKGIFITTSDFSKEALDYVSKIDKKIILINGIELANLMIDANVGVQTETIYEVKRIDAAYFGDE